MKMLRAFLLSLCFILVFFFQIPCLQAVELTGKETVPPAPAQLNTNAYFSCKPNGNGRLTYLDGTHVSLFADCEGQILANGIRIKRGNIWVAYRKKGHYFAITTPTAVIGVRGTDFGVSVNENSLAVILVNGKVTVTPTTSGNTPVILNPGQTYVMESGKSSTHATTQAELDLWKADINELPGSSSSQVPGFSDQYLFGMTMFESGTATLCAPGSNKPVEATPCLLIKSGSNVKTQSDSYAKISLLCGSKITLAPDSEVKIGPLSLGIEKGSCMIRHTGKAYPLKVDGIMPVLIEKNSVVNIERIDDGLLMRVEVGEARHRESQQTICAGECVKVDANGVYKVDNGPVPPSWNHSSSEQIESEGADDISTSQPDSYIQNLSESSQETPSLDAYDAVPEQTISSGTGTVKDLSDTLDF